MEALSIERRDEGAVAVLAVVGIVDMGTSAAFETALSKAVAEGRTRIVLSLAGVSLMGSSGWGAVLALAKKLRDSGGNVAFAALSPPLKSVYQMLAMEGLVASYETEREAVGALS